MNQIVKEASIAPLTRGQILFLLRYVIVQNMNFLCKKSKWNWEEQSYECEEIHLSRLVFKELIVYFD
jgi:hypothetical protein